MPWTSPCLDILVLPSLPSFATRTDQMATRTTLYDDHIFCTGTYSMDFQGLVSTNSQFENGMGRLCNDKQEEHLSTVFFNSISLKDDHACEEHATLIDIATFTSITPSKTPTNF